MKRLVTLTVLALLIGLTGYQASAASDRSSVVTQANVGTERGAASFPTGTWNTGIQVQNPTSSTATVQVKFYDSTGKLVYTTGSAAGEPSTIAAGGSATFYLPNISGLPDGKYSGVVESDQAVVAVVNETNVSGKGIADAYNGITSGSTQLNMPLIFRGFSSWDSMVAVQNTDASNTASVALNFTPTPGSPGTALRTTASIPPLASMTFDISDNTKFSGLGSTFLGSLVVTSTTNVAAVAHSAKQTSAFDVLTIYRGFTTGATKFMAPLVFNQFNSTDGIPTNGWTTGIQVQNMGAQDTVTVAVTMNDGKTYTLQKTVNASSAATFFLPTELTTSGSAIPAGTFGSAVISSGSSQMVVIVNTTKYDVGVADAYNAVADGSGSTRVVAPLVYNQFGVPADTNAWTTGIQVQNMGSSADTVTMTFRPTNASGTFTAQKAIPANGSATFYLPSTLTTGGSAIPTGLYGSADITSGSQKIIAVVNTTKYSTNVATTYLGINE